MVLQTNRRQFILMASALMLAGCHQYETLNIAMNGWIGYQLIGIGHFLEILDHRHIRIVRVGSTTLVRHMLAGETIDCALATLDEVIRYRSEGIPLKVVAILDESMGADQVLARPELDQPSKLIGRRIGAETSAVGQLMFELLLNKLGIERSAIELVPCPADQHIAKMSSGELDAVVTFEPIVQQLKKMGFRTIFSSAEAHGWICDVMAIHEQALAEHSENLAQILRMHFDNLSKLQQKNLEITNALKTVMNINDKELQTSLSGIHFSSIEENYQQISQGKILERAKAVQNILLQHGITPTPVDLDTLLENSILHNLQDV